MKKPSRFPAAAAAALLVLLSAACSSLDPCALYGCPRIDVRNGASCREAYVVNAGAVAKTYSVRYVCGGEVVVKDDVIAASTEIRLGCMDDRPTEWLTDISCETPDCWDIPAQQDSCGYELFDVREAPLLNPEGEPGEKPASHR